MIVIVNYGLGNVYNLKNAIQSIGYEAKISKCKQDILNADILFLPGVGAFQAAMDNLRKNDLIDVLNKRASDKKPIIGICLGMQILFESSTEGGYSKGLGFLKGAFKKFSVDLKIPHMGWNALDIKKSNFISKGLKEKPYAYYVHSYYLTNNAPEDLIISSDYGVKVPGIVQKENIIGLQFHPEKSNQVGLQLLKNIISYYKEVK